MKDIQEIANNFYLSKTNDNFNKLFAYLHPVFFSILRKHRINYVDIDDILSEVFIKLYKYNSFDNNKNFFNFAYTILLNTTYEFKKQKTKKLDRLHKYIDYFLSGYSEEEYKDYIETIQFKYDFIIKIIESLDYDHKDFIIDKYINNLSTDELMQKYNIPESTVKNWLFRGRKMIKDIYRLKINNLI